jgi:hypothetical protein
MKDRSSIDVLDRVNLGHAFAFVLDHRLMFCSQNNQLIVLKSKKRVGLKEPALDTTLERP